MSATRKPGSMAAALRSTMAEESTAKAPVVDAFASRLARADAVMGTGTIPPPAPVEAAAVPRKKKKTATRVRPHTKRDSFNLPPEDHALIESTMARAAALGGWTTKSSVVRAGLHVLARLDDAALRAALVETHPLKPGRKPSVEP